MTIPTQLREAHQYSHSSLSLYRLCPLRWKLHYRDCLEPVHPANRHDMDFGIAFGVGLSAWYETGNAGIALDCFAAAYPQSQYPSVLPKNSQGKTFENGLQGLHDYILQWQEEDKHWTVLQIEEREINDANDRILKLDMVVRDDRDGQVYAVENKTTGGYLDGKFWSRFEPNSQVRMYTDRLTEHYGHCGGFVINAASFKHRSKAYTVRKGQPNAGEVLPVGDWHSFARMTYNPNANALQLERNSSAYWVSRIEADRESGSWGYNDNSCHAFGRECEYYQICEKGYSWPQDKELILEWYRQQCPTVLDEGRCQLALKHEGECDPTRLQIAGQDCEVELDEEIEVSVD